LLVNSVHQDRRRTCRALGLFRVFRRHCRRVGKAHAHRLDGGGHRVGRVHAAAGACARNRVPLDLGQLPLIDLAGRALPHGLEYAITSRETSEYFIPSVPIEMPSLTVMVPNTCGIAPADRSAASARAASFPIPMLHGVMVLCALATPTIGLLKSRSPNPTARSM